MMNKERELLERVLASAHLVNGLDKEIQELLAQPEQEVYFTDIDRKILKQAIGRALMSIKQLKIKSRYHEPLSDDAIWDALPENPMGCAAFIRGVKFAEKMHGIGGK